MLVAAGHNIRGRLRALAHLLCLILARLLVATESPDPWRDAETGDTAEPLAV